MSISLLSSLSVPYSNLYSILVNKSGQQDEIVVSRGGFKLNSWLSKGVGVCAPFVIGGFSGMLATVVIQPLDAMKVQIQIASQSLGKDAKRASLGILTIFKNIYRDKGILIFYRGLQSALFRQLFYASARVGSYNLLIEHLNRKDQYVSSGKWWQKIGISIITGMFGALIGNPFDVVLIRRQATISTGAIPDRNTYQAFRRIIFEEGICSLWTGLKITMLRVVLINIGQLAIRDIIGTQLRQILPTSKTMQDNISSFLASLFTSIITLPVDNIKVKLQKQTGKNNYNGIMDCLSKSIRRQGISRLWIGFMMYFLRGMPHSFLLIRTQLYLTGLFNQHVNDQRQL